MKTRVSDREKVLVTADGSKEIDLQWDEYHARQEFLRKLAPYNITEDEFNQREAHLENKAKQPVNNGSVFWSLLGEKLRSAMEQEDFHTMKMIYHEQAMIWYEEGGDFRKLLSESNKWEMMEYRRSGVVESPNPYCRVKIL